MGNDALGSKGANRVRTINIYKKKSRRGQSGWRSENWRSKMSKDALSLLKKKA